MFMGSQHLLTGCQVACGFHFHQLENKFSSSSFLQKVLNQKFSTPTISSRRLPVMAIPVEPSLSITSQSDTTNDTLLRLIQWPKMTSSNDHRHLVYTLVQPHSSSSSWEILGEQTILNQIKTTSSSIISSVNFLRVLAVHSHGLAQVFSFKNFESEIYNKEIKKNLFFWNLRLNSLVHQKFLVVTEVQWNFPKKLFSSINSSYFINKNGVDPQKSENEKKLSHKKLKSNNVEESEFVNEEGDAPFQSSGSERRESDDDDDSGGSEKKTFSFLLSWEVYGGLVRGHLVTEMNVVTISLWPATSYTLQVGLIDEDQLKLDKGKSIIPQLETVLSSGSELPVIMKSNILSVNTSQAIYSFSKKSFSGEWKRSAAAQLISASQESNTTHPSRGNVESESSSGKSIRLCNWNVRRHSRATEDELRSCVLIWGILILCLVIIFLMFLYFSFAVYLAIRRQVYFQKLHSTCSISSIYNRQFYRLRRNIFRRSRRHGNRFVMGRSATEEIHFSDSSNSSDSETEEADWIV